MVWQDYFARILGESFAAAKKRNARMSLRNYSRRLSVAPGMLSEIIRGRRHVTWDRAVKIAEAAQFGDRELAQLKKFRKAGDERKPRVLLKDDAVDLILNPLYYRVLCAFEILPAPVTVASFADFLDSEPAKVRAVLSTLMAFGLIDAEGDEYTWHGSHVSTPPNITSEKVQAFFREDLKDSVAGLAVAPSEREYTAVTFSGNMSELAVAKKAIREFRDSLSDSMNVEPNQIFQLSIQLRPVSKVYERGQL